MFFSTASSWCLILTVTWGEGVSIKETDLSKNSILSVYNFSCKYSYKINLFVFLYFLNILSIALTSFEENQTIGITRMQIQ